MGSLSNPAVEIASQISETAANTALPGAGAAIAEIESIFGADHAAAVAKEAKTLNNAIPTFINEVEKVMSAAQAGQVTPAQAVGYLQQAQAIYYTTVSKIIHKSGPCDAACEIGGGAPRTDGGTNTNPFCCNTSGTCNASCCIGCSIVEPTVAALTVIINHGSGTWVIPGTQNNGAIIGTRPIKITYTASVVNSVLGTKLAPLVPTLVKTHPYIFAALGIFVVAALVSMGEIDV